MKKLIIFTSTRADYGLLRNLIEKLTSNEKFNVRLLVTGTHLSEKYGDTIEEIYSDGYRNNVDEILISNIDQKNSSEVIGICIQKYSIYLKSKNYNLAIILGREEVESETYTIKDLDSGNNYEKLSLEDLISFLN